MISSVTFRIYENGSVSSLLDLLDIQLIFTFCNQVYDEYIFEGPLHENLISSIEAHFDNAEIKIFNKPGDIVFLYKKCSSQNEDHLQKARGLTWRHKGLIISGYQISRYQYYSVVIFGKEELEKFKDDLRSYHDAELISEQELNTSNFQTGNTFLDIKNIIDLLTDLQLEVLLQCIEQGYYANPRKIHIQDVAAAMNKSLTSIQRVFRSAENKIMDALIPHVHLYFDATRNRN